MFDIIRIPAFKDNYIWLLRKGTAAVVVDPGDAVPVFAALERERLSLAAILVTHHHADHQGGVAALLARSPMPVYGPAAESITGLSHPLRGGETIGLEALGCEIKVLAVPGHTAGHVAYRSGRALFCGDTLFSGGCGRIFEGTPAQLLASLDRLAALPDETRVCCAHEYTLSNLRFAQAVEPGNAAISQHLAHCQAVRERGEPTLPSRIGLERQINPFLRSREPALLAALAQRDPAAQDEVARFAALREWKNGFR